jgi:hypothetical protein
MFLKMIDYALQPYSMEQLRADNPNTSFPATLSEDLLAHYGLQLAPPSVEPAPVPVVTSESVRGQRNALLAASDWTQLADAQLETEGLEAWTQYRQLLRDVSTQAGFPTNVIWPAAPKATSKF